MNLNKEEADVLKILVDKELEHLEKDVEQLVTVNAPFINKVIGDDPDLPFLKSLELYKNFLQDLQKKL